MNKNNHDNYSALGNLICRVSKEIRLLDMDENDYVMFRGQRSNQSLLPSLLRKSSDRIKENNLYCDAWVMAGKELSDARNSWEILAHLQHYGIPTRLLDWSSSLISAIFFAVFECEKCDMLQECDCQQKNKCTANPCIWILNTKAMHETIYAKYDEIYSKVAITIGIDKFPNYVDYFVNGQKNIQWPYNEGPLFIEVPWLSARISSQKGYFTFHPNEQDISKLDWNVRKKFIRKVDVGHDEIAKLSKEMRLIGMTEHDIYQDLLSLGNYLKKKIE